MYLEIFKQVFAKTTQLLTIFLHYFLWFRDICWGTRNCVLHLLTFTKLLISLRIVNFGLHTTGRVLKEKCYRLSRACTELLKLIFAMEAKCLTLFFFFCRKGLKQGKITTPQFFSLFNNDLALDIIKNGRHGSLYNYCPIWLNQDVQNPNAFVNEFKQRLIDCQSQNWHKHVSKSTRLSTECSRLLFL